MQPGNVVPYSNKMDYPHSHERPQEFHSLDLACLLSARGASTPLPPLILIRNGSYSLASVKLAFRPCCAAPPSPPDCCNLAVGQLELYRRRHDWAAVLDPRDLFRILHNCAVLGAFHEIHLENPPRHREDT